MRASVSLTGQFASVDEELSGRENLVLLARLLGFDTVAALEGGLAGFRARILDVRAFRIDAAQQIGALAKARAPAAVARKPKKIAGGCGV